MMFSSNWKAVVRTFAAIGTIGPKASLATPIALDYDRFSLLKWKKKSISQIAREMDDVSF